MNSPSNTPHRDGAPPSDDAAPTRPGRAGRPLSRRERREVERLSREARAAAGASAEPPASGRPGLSGSARAGPAPAVSTQTTTPPPPPPAAASEPGPPAARAASPGLDVDPDPAADDTPKPPPRPAPRGRATGLNGAFDDRTGLFEGPAGAPEVPDPLPDLPETAALSERAFDASAFRRLEDASPGPGRVGANDRANGPANGPRTTNRAGAVAGVRSAVAGRPAPTADLEALLPMGVPVEPAPGSGAADEPRRPARRGTAPSAPDRLPSSRIGVRKPGLAGGGGQPDRRARLVLGGLTAVPALLGALALWVALTALIRLIFHPFIGLFLLAGAGAAVWALVAAARTVLRAEPARLVGAELDAEQHPRLWADVAGLTEALGVPPLQRIVVDGDAVVSLSHSARHRELVVGLPLLIGLDRDQLRALTAHELAHQVAEDPAVGLVYGLGHRIAVASAMAPRGLPRYALIGYARFYRALATAGNEQHELHCDDRAAAVVGAATLAAALRRVEAVGLAWQVLVNEYLPLSARAQRRPSLAEGVRNILASRGEDLARAALTAAPARTLVDAHPAPEARIARLGSPAPAPAQGASAAAELLSGGEADLPPLEYSILMDDDPEAGWAQIVARAAEAELELATARLARAALAAGVAEPVCLAALLEALAAERGPQIVESLLRPAIPAADRPAEAVAVLREHLTAFVTLVQIRSGLARYLGGWDGPPLLQRRAGRYTPWPPPGSDDSVDRLVADAATSGLAVAALRDRLQAEGADLSTAVDAAPEPPPRALSAFADVELCGPFDARQIDLVLYSTGLLLAPAPAPTPLRALEQRLQLPSATTAAERIVALAEELGGQPETCPGGWWIELGSVTLCQLRERRSGMELQLRLSDGAGATIRATPRTQLRGTPVDDVNRLLPTMLA